MIDAQTIVNFHLLNMMERIYASQRATLNLFLNIQTNGDESKIKILWEKYVTYFNSDLERLLKDRNDYIKAAIDENYKEFHDEFTDSVADFIKAMEQDKIKLTPEINKMISDLHQKLSRLKIDEQLLNFHR